MFGTILETNLETILGIIFGTPNIPRLTVIGGKSKTGIFKRTYGLNDGPGDYVLYLGRLLNSLAIGAATGVRHCAFEVRTGLDPSPRLRVA